MAEIRQDEGLYTYGMGLSEPLASMRGVNTAASAMASLLPHETVAEQPTFTSAWEWGSLRSEEGFGKYSVFLRLVPA